MKVRITKLNYDWDIVEVNDFGKFIDLLNTFAGHLVKDIEIVNSNTRVTADAQIYLPTLSVKSDNVFYVHIPALNYLLVEGKFNDDDFDIKFIDCEYPEYLLFMCNTKLKGDK